MNREELTKEAFKEIFDNNFQMTNFAIELAQKQIHAGNEELNIDELLNEIRRAPPKFNEVKESQDQDSQQGLGDPSLSLKDE